MCACTPACAPASRSGTSARAGHQPQRFVSALPAPAATTMTLNWLVDVIASLLAIWFRPAGLFARGCARRTSITELIVFGRTHHSSRRTAVRFRSSCVRECPASLARAGHRPTSDGAASGGARTCSAGATTDLTEPRPRAVLCRGQRLGPNAGGGAGRGLGGCRWCEVVAVGLVAGTVPRLPVSWFGVSGS
jgi:hypothetical protein